MGANFSAPMHRTNSRYRGGPVSFPDEILPTVCSFLDAPTLLAAGAASRGWRWPATQDTLWRPFCAKHWRSLQKNASFRPWWRELLNAGLASPPELALTSSATSRRGLKWTHITENIVKNVAAEASRGSWHKRYVMVELDQRKCSIDLADLLYDSTYDAERYVHGTSPWSPEDPADAPSRLFPRRWLLASGALREHYLGDELQLKEDGFCEARSCLLILEPRPEGQWRWEREASGQAVLITYRVAGCSPRTHIFKVKRATDGGFLLVGPEDVIFCSREKTEEEHVYRRYNRLRYPAHLTETLRAFAGGSESVCYSFPTTLTSFERLVVHRVSDDLGITHDSIGIGVQRRIVVFRGMGRFPYMAEHIPYMAEEEEEFSSSEGSASPSPPVEPFPIPSHVPLAPVFGAIVYDSGQAAAARTEDTEEHETSMPQHQD